MEEGSPSSSAPEFSTQDAASGAASPTASPFAMGTFEQGQLDRKFFPLGTKNPGMRMPTYFVDPAELAKIEPPAVVRTWEQRLEEDNDEEQRAKYAEFRAVVLEEKWDEKGIDEWATLRFLIARQYDIKKATKMLRAHVEWLEEMKPATVTCPGCEVDPSNHMMHFAGWDIAHRPVLYLSYFHAKERADPDWAIAHNIATFNHAFSLMPQGIEQWVAVTDFVSYSHWRDGRSSVGKVVLDMMQNHYPERLALQILVDPPTAFWVLFKVLSAFIDEKTKKKVRFWYTTQEPFIQDEFPKIFPPAVADYLVQSYLNNKTAYADRKQAKKDESE